MLPTFDDIQALHKRYAPSQEAFDLIFTHCLIVRDIAEDLLQQSPHLTIDKELVRAGAVLHDIGAYTLIKNGKITKNYITHGIRGSEILSKEGHDPRLIRIASHHTGVGLTKDEVIAQALPLPHEDFLAETIEERLIMYADKFHSKTPQFNTYEAYAKTVAKFGDTKEATFGLLKEEFGLPDITLLAQKYRHPVV